MRIFLCEEQPVIVEAMARILGDTQDLALAGAASSLHAAFSAVAGRNFDLFVLGQPPSARSVLPLLAMIADALDFVPIVLWVTDIGEVDIFRALRMGVRGMIRRTDRVPDILQCLRAVGAGETWLGNVALSPTRPSAASSRITRREREVIELVCRGLGNQQIAESLAIAPGTVKVHLTHIFEKTGVRDRFALAEQGRKLLQPRSEPSV